MPKYNIFESFICVQSNRMTTTTYMIISNEVRGFDQSLIVLNSIVLIELEQEGKQIVEFRIFLYMIF